MTEKTSELITGVSSGIGAVYADRFARRGHDLVLVARDAARLHALTVKLEAQCGINVEVMPADLTAPHSLETVAQQLRKEFIHV